MLVLERSLGETVWIGDEINVCLLRVVSRKRIKLGIDAPRHIRIVREENVPEMDVGEASDEPDARRAQPLRILVVEDDLAQGRIITRVLAQSGAVRVDLVRTGADARQRLLRCEERTADAPDLLLLDFRLPDVRGDELIEQIRASESLRNIPIVMLSCASSADDVGRCLEAGANAFVEKRSDLGEFRESILRIVDFWSHARRVA